MVGRRTRILILAGAALTPLVGGLAGADEGPRFMPTTGPATAPAGFLEFCRGHQADCAARIDRGLLVELDDARLLDLTVVNRAVNTQIHPSTDLEIYGREEVWAMPTTVGDCEDYVLLKRRQLLKRGWPASSLLVTVVRDERGEGHAVLTVRTTRGDLILDNKVDVIRPWYSTPYAYVKRQATTNARWWVRIDDTRPDAAVASIRR